MKIERDTHGNIISIDLDIEDSPELYDLELNDSGVVDNSDKRLLLIKKLLSQGE